MTNESIYTQLRNELDLDRAECAEVMTEMRDKNDDFNVADFRFIHSDSIDSILKDELSSDTYVLGCFSDWFIADVCNVPLSMVQACQKAEAYEGLGELMLDHIDEVVRQCVAVDGYGHFFGLYDGNEYEFGDYYAFRIN